MFRRWPFFQRLLSWTKPYAPEARTAREYQRYDWNSLIADEPELRSLQAEFMDGSSYFPSRPEMEANLEAFAERAAIAVRYDCEWQATALEEGPDGTIFVLETTRRRVPDAEPRARGGRGGAVEPVAAGHRARAPLRRHPRCRVVRRQADLHHRQAELRVRARVRARGLGVAIIVCSPSPAKLSVEKRSLAGVRARYVQPFEDNFLGPGREDPRRRDRRDRPGRRRAAGRPEADRHRRGPRRRWPTR